MSTATIDGPQEVTSRRPGSNRSRQASADSRRELVDARVHTEAAVTDLVASTTDAVRAFLPSAVLRPTQAVDYVFDVIEQTLVASRRMCLELATIVESGLQGVERRAA